MRVAALLLPVVLAFGGCRAEETARRPDGGTQDAGSAPDPSAPLPPADVVALVEGILTPEGKRVFYDAAPRVLDKAQFDTACPADRELTVVLGCYHRRTIAILRVDRQDLTGIMTVTAVHEMLHAAYFDLSARERDRVDGWVRDFYAGLHDPEIRELVDRYDREDPRQRANELHSILPTEVAALSPPLEDYYGRYFVDRLRVVAAHERYADVFRQLERRVEQLHGELGGLKSQLDSLERGIASTEGELSALDTQMSHLRARGEISAHNALVPRQNALADEHNGLVVRFNQLVEVYNRKVNEVNALAFEQDQLATSLGSKPSISPAGAP